MDLYHVVTSYHLLSAMVCLARNPQKAVLLVSQWIPEKFPHYEDLKQYFDTIIVGDASYVDHHSFEQTECYFKSLLGDIAKYENIYLWGAHYSLGVVLAERNLPFVLCEEAAGILSRPEILITIFEKQKIQNTYRAKHMGLFNGDDLNATKLLGNQKAQRSGFSPAKKMIDFDIVENLQALERQKRNRILDFFVPRCTIPLPVNATILLTQHFANLRMMSFEQQALIYQLFVDYFILPQKLVIKPHPDDLMYYHRLFPAAQVIREKFPSEFMPFLFDNQPKCMATISSTSIYNLRGHYPEVLELDNRYETDFPLTHRYYAAMCIAQKLRNSVVCIGANELLAQKLLETLKGDHPNILGEVVVPAHPCTILVDDISSLGEESRQKLIDQLKNLNEASAVIFINSMQDYCWYDYFYKNLWNDIVPIVIKKTILEPQSTDFYADTVDEVIYFYSKSEEVRHMTQEVNIEKNLPHTGISLERRNMTPEQERIKILEGILAATEKRLLYYIEKDRKSSDK